MANLLRTISILASCLLLSSCKCLPVPAADTTQPPAKPSIDTVGQAFALPAADPNGIRVRFGGVSTLVFEEDGEPALMIDGFFSRPSFPQLLVSRIGSDPKRIRDGLQALGMDGATLQAVIPLHAHYDHAMDSPAVARLTSAKLVGDASIENIGLGGGLDPEQIDKVVAGQTSHYGRWRVTFIAADHAPTLLRFPGVVEKPLKQKARVWAWREGQPWTLLIEHADGKTFLVHGSAGYRRCEISRALSGRRVDVVFLGVGGAGRPKSPKHRDQLWSETVRAADARRVIPIHWDDFSQSLEAPLRPMPRVSDNLTRTMEHFGRLAANEQRDIRFPPLFDAFDPYENLVPDRPARLDANPLKDECRE